MPVLRKRDKNYFIDYRVNGKRVRKSVGKNRKIAELALKDIEVKLATNVIKVALDFPRKNGHRVKLVLSSSQIEPDSCILSLNDDGYGYKTIQCIQISSVSHPFLL